MKLFKLALGAFALLLPGVILFAQTIPEQMPLDAAVRIGRLDNGLTYYLRHHENPKDRADFYIVHNVGAMQEEDSQNGLAHFLEHMAFNGTKNFPDKMLLEYMAANGVKFGQNVNAYTSRNHTAYQLMDVPLRTRSSFLDSVVLVLHDWSYYISCEAEEIEAERGVIREEWRRRNDSRTRMANQEQALIALGSKYPRRTVIGNLDVVNTFKPEELTAFYHKWYRPDLQAVMVVGDFDLDTMELRLRRVLSNLPHIKDGAPKEEYLIEPQEGIRVGVLTDADVSYVTAKVYLKQPYPSAAELALSSNVRDVYARRIFAQMLHQRFEERVRSCDSLPYRMVIAVDNQFFNQRYTTMMTIMPSRDEGLAEAVRDVLLELRRVELYGFTSQEFSEAKAAIGKKYRVTQTFTPSNVTNGTLISAYVAHFAMGVPYVEPQVEDDIRKQIYEALTLEDLNAMTPVMITDAEKVVAYSMNDTKRSLAPSEEQTIALFEQAAEARPARLGGVSGDEQLPLTGDLSSGRVVKVRKMQWKGMEEWTLSNGIRVIWNPVDSISGANQMAITGNDDRGYLQYGREDIPGAKLMSSYLSKSFGVGKLDPEAVRRITLPYNFSCSLDVSSSTATASGSSSCGDFEQMLRMIHLYVTQPNFDNAPYDRYLKRVKASFERPASKLERFNDSCRLLMYGDDPRLGKVCKHTCETTPVEKIREYFETSFGDMSRFRFFVTGTMPVEQVRELVGRYLGTLPAGKDNYRAMKSSYKLVRGVHEFRRATANLQEVPKSSISSMYYGDLEYSSYNQVVLNYLRFMLRERCMKTIREQKGATYSVGIKMELDKENGYQYDITFDTNPELVDDVLPDISAALAALAASGPTPEEMTETSSFLRKTHSQNCESREHNLSFNQNRSMDRVRYGQYLQDGVGEQFDRVTAADVQRLAKTVAEGNQFCFVYTH